MNETVDPGDPSSEQDPFSDLVGRLRLLRPATAGPEPVELYYRAGYAAAMAERTSSRRASSRWAIPLSTLMAAMVAAAIIGPVCYRWGRETAPTSAVVQTVDDGGEDPRLPSPSVVVDVGPPASTMAQSDRRVADSAEVDSAVSVKAKFPMRNGSTAAALSSWTALAQWWQILQREDRRLEDPYAGVPQRTRTLTAFPTRWDADQVDWGLPRFSRSTAADSRDDSPQLTTTAPPTLQARDWQRWPELVVDEWNR